MRIKHTKYLAFFIVFVNLLIVFYTWKLFQSVAPFRNTYFEEPKQTLKPHIKHVSKLVTLVIRDFDLQENDVTGTVLSFIKVFPNIQVLIVSEGLPYPPLQLSYLNETFRNVKFINLEANLNVPYKENPLYYIKSNYVLFVPDSSRILHRQSVQQMINYITKHPNDIVTVPYTVSKNLTCLNVSYELQDWIIRLSTTKGLCDVVTGKHAVMIALGTLLRLNTPLILPHPHSMYIQTAFLNYKVKVLPGVQFQDGKLLFHSHHSQRLKRISHQSKSKRFYQMYSVKHVIRENGIVENYGCNRDTARCFGSIINYTPSYFYENKTTPPCCLVNLRKTARHVFNSLHEAGIRFWLEGGSLLGAMRSGDVIPWDFDVDIGFNRDDLSRCVWLKKAKNKPVFDTKGFLWEKATEGNFYRVHYSKVNRIYVNIFPYYSHNGSMLKDSWFSSWKNVDFPEQFLHPMSSIDFIGRKFPSPNNIRDFLEYRFGKGTIENKEYPDFKTKFT